MRAVGAEAKEAAQDRGARQIEAPGPEDDLFVKRPAVIVIIFADVYSEHYRFFRQFHEALLSQGFQENSGDVYPGPNRGQSQKLVGRQLQKAEFHFSVSSQVHRFHGIGRKGGESPQKSDGQHGLYGGIDNDVSLIFKWSLRRTKGSLQGDRKKSFTGLNAAV
jgi:hypothetical protein